jgi:hypothetical protein
MTGHTRANAFDDPDLLRKKSGMQGEDFDCTSLFKYDIALIDPSVNTLHGGVRKLLLKSTL